MVVKILLSHHYRNHGTYVHLLITDREATCFLLNLVLMRDVENLLVEMGDVSCILNGESGRIEGERTKMG